MARARRTTERDRGQQRCHRAFPGEDGAVIEEPDDSGTDEQQGHLGLQGHRDDEADPRDHPLQPVFHPEPRQAVAGVENQGDDGGTDPIEDGCDRRQSTEVDVEGAEGRHDEEVGEDEGPAARPGPPDASPEIRDKDADLDRQRARQRLTDGDPLPHLLLRQPLPFADELPLHLSAQSDRPPDAARAEAQEIAHELRDWHSRQDAGFRHYELLPLVWCPVSPRPPDARVASQAHRLTVKVTVDTHHVKRYTATTLDSPGGPTAPSGGALCSGALWESRS